MKTNYKLIRNEKGKIVGRKKTLKPKKCPTCKQVFQPKDSSKKYCGRECYYEMKRIRKDRVKWTSEMRKKLSEQYTGEGNPMFGREPWSKGKKRPEISGRRHWNYRGGWIQGGYRYISINGETYPEHKRVLEEKIGRELKENEVTHHVNGNKLDNRPENLMVMTRAEHMNLHREDIVSIQ